MCMCRKRKIKVAKRHRKMRIGYKVYPEIRICALWLEKEYGFEVGDVLELKPTSKGLVIQKPTV